MRDRFAPKMLTRHLLSYPSQRIFARSLTKEDHFQTLQRLPEQFRFEHQSEHRYRSLHFTFAKVSIANFYQGRH